MERNLYKFYIFFLITFILLVKFLPNIFFNINNTINYFNIKTQLMLKSSANHEVIIDNDKGNVIIMLDDGWKTQYDVAFKYMNKFNMVGSIAVITNLVNNLNYINTGNLYDLYENNWDLVNHTADHIDLSKNTIVEQEKNIKEGQKWLENHDFDNKLKILIYPYGYYNDDTLTILKKLKVASGRSVNDGFNPQYAKSLYDIKIKNVLSNTNPKAVMEWINHTIENKLTLILLFHKLEPVTDTSLMQYDDKDFYKIIDYLNQVKNNVNIITYSDWIKVSLFYN